MSSAGRSVVVIGSGIIGASCAYYLNKTGWTVTLLDKGAYGRGCSHANCGYVCPSHVLPLAEPGAATRALKSLLQKNSPFYIKPRLDPRLWTWLFRFAMRCNHKDMLSAGGALHTLLQSSMSEYLEWDRDGSLKCEWERRGLMFVYLSEHEFKEYAATDRLLREKFGVGARELKRDALLDLEPALKPNVAGGWHYEGDAQLRPDKLMQSLRKLLIERGVKIVENAEVKNFKPDADGRAASVVVNNESIAADTFVVATGAWAPFLEKELGCHIPIQPGKGYSITMARPQRCPKIPMIFHEHRVACSPFPSGYRLGSTMEFAGYDATLNRKRLQMLKDAAVHYLHEPYTDTVEEEWFGWRPMTCDGLPVIDFSPRYKNVLIAAGHNMLGLSMAPATGKLVSEMLNKSAPHLDHTPFALSRFN